MEYINIKLINILVKKYHKDIQFFQVKQIRMKLYKMIYTIIGTCYTFII